MPEFVSVCLLVFESGNGSPSATNVVVVVILHRATVAIFDVDHLLISILPYSSSSAAVVAGAATATAAAAAGRTRSCSVAASDAT